MRQVEKKYRIVMRRRHPQEAALHIHTQSGGLLPKVTRALAGSLKKIHNERGANWENKAPFPNVIYTTRVRVRGLVSVPFQVASRAEKLRVPRFLFFLGVPAVDRNNRLFCGSAQYNLILGVSFKCFHCRGVLKNALNEVHIPFRVG